MSEIEKAEEQLRIISQDRALRAQYEARMKAQRDAIAWEKDHEDKWKAEGKREALLTACELLGIVVSPERSAELALLNLERLDQLLQQIKKDRVWPTG